MLQVAKRPREDPQASLNRHARRRVESGEEIREREESDTRKRNFPPQAQAQAQAQAVVFEKKARLQFMSPPNVTRPATFLKPNVRQRTFSTSFSVAPLRPEKMTRTHANGPDGVSADAVFEQFIDVQLQEEYHRLEEMGIPPQPPHNNVVDAMEPICQSYELIFM